MNVSELRAVVTGGGSGMGRAFTLELAQAGADVIFCDLNEESIARVEAAGEKLAGRVIGVVADVADEVNVSALFDRAEESFGSVNALINNAGIFRDRLLVKQNRKTGEVETMSLKEWQQVIDVDLTGPFLCTRELAARAIKKKVAASVVVNISSVSRHGNPGQSNYSAAKAGLVADTKLWAVELARYNIRVGAIAPGFVQTPILEGMRPEVLEGILKRVPLRRVATTQEIYQAVRFIIECDYFTGKVIDVDGGLSF